MSSKEMLDALLSPFGDNDNLNESAQLLKDAIQRLFRTREIEIYEDVKDVLLNDGLAAEYKRSEDYRYEVVFRLHKMFDKER